MPAGTPQDDATFLTLKAESTRYTIFGNVIDMRATPDELVAFNFARADHDIYLNTIIDADAVFDLESVGAGSMESMCNLFIGIPTPFIGSNPPVDATIGYDAYVASGGVTERVHTGTAYQNASLAAMNFDDLRIPYKLITGPEFKTFTNIVPTAASPAAFRGLCPGTGDADTMGSRVGLGVDDSAADWP